MRALLFLIAAALPATALAGDTPDDAPKSDGASGDAAFAMPGHRIPSHEWHSVEDAERMKECRDRITQVREDRGLPELQRETAEPDEPLLIAAVEHRIEGCSVLVMRHDTSDVRPLPEPPVGPVQLIPAR